MTQPKLDPITIRCQCGAKLRLPAAAIGKRVKCPKCTHTFVAQKPQRTPQPQRVEDEVQDSNPLLDELAALADSAPIVRQTSGDGSESPCPKCEKPLPTSAVLCVHCGYDKRLGKGHGGASIFASVLSKLAASTGTFLFGCLLSGVGALIGALIWFAVAIGAEVEIGWIAWGIGLLAGFGMLKGFGAPDARAGVVAAGIAGAGVLGAKVMIFAFIVYGVITGDTKNIDVQRGYVAGRMVEERMAERDFEPEENVKETWDVEYDRADRIVSNYTDDDVHDAWQRYREKEAQNELQGKRVRLAVHNMTIAAQAQGLRYDDEKFGELFERELAQLQAMDTAQLDAQMADLETWEEKEKWEDVDYVRNALIYEHVDEALAELDRSKGDESVELDDEERTDLDAKRQREEWDTAYAGAVAVVDAMPVGDRRRELQRLEREREESFKMLMEEYRAEESLSEGSMDEAGGIFTAFVQSMFAPLDLLFIFLAVSSAYKIGAYGSGE